MIRPFAFVLFVLMLWSGKALGQMGTITGTVHDQSSGEELVGANVLIIGTTLGASTDIDGKFSIRGITPGLYDVRVSMLGYVAKVVAGVSVVANQTVMLHVAVTATTYDVDEVVVTAEVVMNSEAALIGQRKKARAIQDGISQEQIRRTPDATSGEALKRVTGLSIVDNKFVYVRGITDRYNSTTLDGASVSSTEVGKKSFSFDLIPANLIENTVVVKTATPDLPGDFTGGLVQVNTLDIPTRRLLRLGVSTSYNDLATGRQFLVSQGGSRDWLGFDNGARALPSTDGSLTDLAKSLPNNWSPRSQKAPYNGSFSLTYGDEFRFGDDNSGGDQFGIVTSLTYNNSFQRTEVDINELTSGGFLLRRYSGVKDKYSVLWGAIGNLAYKISPLHKISFKNSYNNSAEDDVGRLTGEDGNTGSEERRTSVRWTQRSAYTGQLIGDHSLPGLFGLQVQWRGTVSSSRREDPDRKLIPYVRSVGSAPEDPFYVATSDRSWEVAHDRSKGIGMDLTLPLNDVRTRAGVYYEDRVTDYRIKAYRILGVASTRFELYTQPIDSVFKPENFGPGGFAFQENPSNVASFYDASQEMIAGYAMVDVPFSLAGQDFRFVGGARVENSLQNLYSIRSLTDPVRETTQLKNVDILPSVNLTYMFNGFTNLRLAYSQSVNRPEFRELAPIAYYDFDRLETVYGNPTLKRALIRNYDARLELFPGIGELVAVSYFHKVLSNPIEEQIDVSSTPIRTYVNSRHATNTGWELELRKSLDFIGEYFGNILITGNYTRIQSSVEMVDEVAAGVLQTSTRPLHGQSPYMINLGILFTEPTTRTSLSIFYNTYGRRIDAVGSSISEPDIYEEPRDLIDLTVSQPLLGILDAKFSVRNLNGKKEVLTKRGEFYRSNATGTSYSLSLSATL
jgi:hypothetical protein